MDDSSGPPAEANKIPPVFFTAFLSEQNRSFEEKRKEIAKVFPANDQLITQNAAHLIVTLLHVVSICEAYSEAIDYIEDMLQKQLIAAIGKKVTPVDFTNYLAFHNRKIFREQYRPKTFSYAIRRPDHYPEVLNFNFSIKFTLFTGNLVNRVSSERWINFYTHLDTSSTRHR